jgi:hypothetical protein
MRAVPAAVAALFAIPSVQAEIVYSAFRTPLLNGGCWVLNDHQIGETDSGVELPGGLENDVRTGQAITLAGTSRFVTAFTVRNFSFASTTVTMGMTLTMYESVGGLPGAELWSGRQTLTSPGAGVGHTVDVTYTPNILVPDSIVFGIALDSISGQPTNQAQGPAYQHLTLPTIGSADDRVLIQDSTTLQWAPDPTSPPGENYLQARIEAIPAPSTVMGVGALCLAFVRRRR